MAVEQNTIAAIAALAVRERQCYLIRYRKDSVLSGTALYDAKPYGTGGKRGWTALDITVSDTTDKTKAAAWHAKAAYLWSIQNLQIENIAMALASAYRQGLEAGKAKDKGGAA